MVFSSLSFLFFFLPLVMLSYFLFPGRVYRNVVLTVFSLLFYSWGEPKFILLMLATCLTAWLGGLLIDKYRACPRSAKAAAAVTVILLLLNLFVFKYLNFAVDNISALLGRRCTLAAITLPIGISFYTFQILSYVIDLYRGKISLQRSFFRLLLYVCFFPQLIAGPIVRYSTVEDEISNRRENTEDIVYGVKRFIIGLAKKLILANNVAAVAETVYAGSPEFYGTAMYWIAALSYTLQIYFDFSGYSDMAIGLGRVFGFHFLENFRHPYMADSLTEYWRRWHISMASWFRDYVYIPLGGNRCGKPRWILNIFTVWALTGLWHGADWNYLLWGLFNGAVLVVERLWLLKPMERLPHFLRCLLTFILINITMVIFNCNDLAHMAQAFKMMLTPHATDWLGVVAADGTILKGLLYLPMALACMFPILDKLPAPRTRGRETLRCGAYLALFTLCCIYTVSSTYNPFIYFRF